MKVAFQQLTHIQIMKLGAFVSSQERDFEFELFKTKFLQKLQSAACRFETRDRLFKWDPISVQQV